MSFKYQKILQKNSNKISQCNNYVLIAENFEIQIIGSKCLHFIFLFCTLTILIHQIDSNRISIYVHNLGHNILELCNVLVQIRFTTSKTKRDIQYSKLNIRVASRVAERLKILGNKEISENSQIWVEAQARAKASSQKLNFGNNSRKTGKGRYQTFAGNGFLDYCLIKVSINWICIYHIQSATGLQILLAWHGLDMAKEHRLYI